MRCKSFLFQKLLEINLKDFLFLLLRDSTIKILGHHFWPIYLLKIFQLFISALYNEDKDEYSEI